MENSSRIQNTGINDDRSWRVLRFAVVFASFVFSAGTRPAIARALPQVCSGSDVHRIQRPYFPQQKDSKTFTYSFRVIPGTAPDAPVVVFIPGGPGAESIAFSDYRDVFFHIPKSYTAVFTDPRGRGCNDVLEDGVSSDVFSTENFASDILAAINELRPKRYIIYGSSYGTALGTVVAARARSGEAKVAPEAVVLQSILGHAFFNGSTFEGFADSWARLKTQLSSTVLNQLTSDPLPLGESADAWGKFIYDGLMTGVTPAAEPSLKTQLMWLESQGPADHKKLKEAIQKVANKPVNPGFMKVYRPIWCHEFASKDNLDPALVRGELVAERDPDVCKEYPLDRPYDSSQYLLAGPIFYFAGESDPATYMAQAYYHFSHQRDADRFFVTVPDAGHAPMSNLFDCQERYWNAIARRGAGFKEAIRSCKGSTSVIHAPPVDHKTGRSDKFR